MYVACFLLKCAAIDGIVTCQAYWATAQAVEEKERQKKQERVIKRWQKLVNGLRIRVRLLKEYSVSSGPGQKVSPLLRLLCDPFSE